MTTLCPLLLAAVLCSSPLAAFAQPAPVDAGPVLSLNAEVSESVVPDQMRMVLAVERTSRDLGAANTQVLTLTNAALAQAKQTTDVEASLGQVSTQPVYDDKGRVGSWQVRAEVMLVSKNFDGLSALGGKLSERLELAEVGFVLSPKKKAEVQERLLDKVGAEFRTKATRSAKSLGFARAEIKSVALGEGGFDFPNPRYGRVAPKMAMMAAAPGVPTDAGKATVTVSMSGTVLLER